MDKGQLGRKSLWLVLALLLVWQVPASFGEEKKITFGFSVYGGTGANFIYAKPDINIVSLLPRAELKLHRSWNLEIEGDYSYLAISREPDLWTLGLNANIVFAPFQWKWGSLFALAGAGPNYSSAGDRIPQLGDTHLGGILHGGAGLTINLGKGTALRGEYRFKHFSQPLKSDKGLNTHGLVLGFSF
jgi:opacity protein-like surface antigen